MITRAERELWRKFSAQRTGGSAMTFWLAALDAADALREHIARLHWDCIQCAVGNKDKCAQGLLLAAYDAAVEPKV